MFLIKKFLMVTSICTLILYPGLCFASKHTNITLGNIILNGIYSNDDAGYNVSTAGDLNNDDKDDFIIGAPNTGNIFIIYSSTATPNFTLASSDHTITANNSLTGKTLTSAGDLDGDNIPDFVISSQRLNKIYVFLGKNAQFWSSEMTVSNADASFNTTNMDTLLESFQYLSMNGDVNGDGYDDLLIGLHKTDNNKGTVCLIYGRDDFDTLDNISLDTGSISNVDVYFKGEDVNDHAGYSVDIIPDINSDGFDDILIGAHSYSYGSGTGRKVYLIYGKRKGLFENLNMTTHEFDLADADAVFYARDNGSDGFGETVAGLGDINGDGYGDFIIGAPGGNSLKGTAYLYYGGAGKPYTSKVAADNSTGYASSSIQMQGSAYLGLRSIHSLGDINGDLLKDFVIGEYNTTNYTGQAHIFFGQTQKYTETITTSDIVVHGVAENHKAGFSASNAGDINSDGIDEYIIGAPGYNNNTGIASIFMNQKNITPNVSALSSSALKIYRDSDYTSQTTTASNYQKIYLELDAGSGAESGTKNITELVISSNYSDRNIEVRLLETSVDSHLYRGCINIVRSRSSGRINQIAATSNDTIHIRHFDNLTLNKSIDIVNALPFVQNAAVVQVGIGINTKFRIDYTLYDYDSDKCNFNTDNTQVQFSIDNGLNWIDAALSGQISDITSSETGQYHSGSSQSEALYWDAYSQVSLNETNCIIRIKPHDGSGYAPGYTITNSFSVDNTAPTAPALSSPSVKNTYSITVTGNAEANSTIYLYVSETSGSNKTPAATAYADSNGNFSAYPVTVSETLNRITSICEDQVGLQSPESEPVYISFASLSQTLQNNEITVEINMPVNAAPSDKELTLTRVATSSIETPLLYYKHLVSFDLTQNGESHVTLSAEAIVTVNVPVSLEVVDFVKVYYWNQNLSTPEWMEKDVTINYVSDRTISFSTKYLTRYVINNLIDQYAPVVDNIKVDGGYVNNNYVSTTPRITVDLSDVGSGISNWSITVTDKATDTLVTQNSGFILSTNNITAELAITTPLIDGEFEIVASAWDNSIHKTTNQTTIQVNSSVFEFSILNAPNPFNPGHEHLIFGYNLSLEALSVQIFVINLNGDILWSFNAEPDQCTAGYHRIEWDGTDGFSIVPNGLYYAYCIAKTETEVKNVKLKIAVLQ